MSFTSPVIQATNRSALDAPIAALAGLSVAFAAFTIPADLLGELVLATRLPEVAAVAEPPLGLNARLLIAGFGAIAVFAFSFIVLRLLGRVGQKRPRAIVRDEDIETDVPLRLRRRDIHPDAPPPAPLRARDIGEPMTAGLWDRSQRDGADVVDHEPEPQHEPAVEVDDFWGAEGPPPPVPVRVPQPPETKRAWLADPSLIPPQPAASRTDMLDESAAETQVRDESDESEDPAPGQAAPVEIEELQQPADAPSWLTRPDPDAEDAPAAELSLAELVERLQAGMARRRRPVAALPETAPDSIQFASSTEDRLQGAIDSLQRLASRQR